MHYDDTGWRDIDFRPAPVPGWRVVYIDESEGAEPGSFFTGPLAGWLVQESPNGDRRVVPAHCVEDGMPSELDCREWETNVMCVLGPGEHPPTSERVAAEYRWRLQLRERRAERAMERMQRELDEELTEKAA